MQIPAELTEAQPEVLVLRDDDLAIYDALDVNESAVRVMSNDTLRVIAQALVATVRRNVSIDWIVKESVRANLRCMVRRILHQHGYPPDKAEQTTATVLEQAELNTPDWAG